MCIYSHQFIIKMQGSRRTLRSIFTHVRNQLGFVTEFGFSKDIGVKKSFCYIAKPLFPISFFLGGTVI